MCGISGIVDLENSSLHLPGLIQKMTDAIRHRGPDGEGYVLASQNSYTCAFGKDTPENIAAAKHFYSPKKSIESITENYQLAFGHRRLAIIDLTPSGHQPMCLSQQNIWITYNGEIYNYIELRDELKQKGHSFETSSDTEVILKAYQEWGTECVHKFNGMWAFVIFDAPKNKLFGSRDRFGVKPLYYIHKANCFAFASEQKALLASQLIQPKLNPTAVFDYFVFSKIETEEEGMFQEILELQQAHNFEFSLTENKLRKWKYYSLPFTEAYQNFSEKTFQSYVEQTRELLFESIRLRLRSDVPVGSCLSGGIDSSSIVGIMNHYLKEQNQKINLFTAGFSEPEIDESKWAKMVADASSSKWNRTFPNSDELKKDLENLSFAQDIPIWSTSTYAQYRVMQLAKETGVKVILDGQGGDELWAGYPHQQAFFFRELVKNNKFGEAVSLLKNAGNFPENATWFAKQYLKHGGLAHFPKTLVPGIYKQYFSHLAYLNLDFLETYKSRYKIHFEKSPANLNAILQQETTNGLLKSYLKCEDRCSMWHSVESRTPFADDLKLIEFAFQTPSAFKIHNKQSKFILRQAMQGTVPQSILERQDKMGYSTPNSKWMAAISEHVKPYFTGELAEILNLGKIEKEYDTLFDANSSNDNGQTFKFISFALWHKIFKL
jgi:asparagine synthase (glutamine-hydrolysing)